MNEPDRLAELLGALSLASDRARGQASESALGTTILATRLAQWLGMAEEEVAETYFVALTRTLGCTSMAMDVSTLALGDDLSFSYAMHMSDLADTGSVRDGLQKHFATSADPEKRKQAIDTVLELQPVFPQMAAPLGQQAVALSQRLPLPPNVPALLEQLDARWDGKNPTKPGGEDISLIVRVGELATVLELYRRAGGVQAAVDISSERSGGQFDPRACAVFERHTADLLEGFDKASLWDLFLDTEPAPVSVIDEDHRLVIAEVSADFTDNKSGWFVGNSRRVAQLGLTAAERMGWSADDCMEMMLAGLMYDIGRCAVPNGIWDKPERLSDRELVLAQTHSQQTEEILAACPPLRAIARLAGAAHERRDGSGYHRASTTRDKRAELLAACDVYIALRSDRPWRDAHSESATIEILSREADEGRLSPVAVQAVLEIGGHRATATSEKFPDGLTSREVQVLEQLARGLLTKQIASKLGIAYKTVDNHVQNLYRKIGANTRTAAAMYAVEHGIYPE